MKVRLCIQLQLRVSVVYQSAIRKAAYWKTFDFVKILHFLGVLDVRGPSYLPSASFLIFSTHFSSPAWLSGHDQADRKTQAPSPDSYPTQSVIRDRIEAERTESVGFRLLSHWGYLTICSLWPYFCRSRVWLYSCRRIRHRESCEPWRRCRCRRTGGKQMVGLLVASWSQYPVADKNNK